MASDPLTRDEARRLVEMTGMIGQPYAALRDQAAMAVLYRCGLRSNECRMLDVSDLRRTSGGATLRVRFPKGVDRGAKPRELGVDSGTIGFIDTWLELRGSEPGPLFCSAAGGRVHLHHWRRKIKKSAKAAGITRRVHLHGLRHTFARMMHDEGVSLRVIKDSLGHASLATTDVYLSSLGSPEVVAATIEREW